ncbi:MAG: putative permease [Candidatus Midichloriaceae bacterium]|jgi:predicted permease|nr:putative permease [Candidatus Midichloriaceae bacterium]
MDLVFLDLFYKILPLYFLIAFGFIVGKVTNVDRQSIANLLFYLIIPAVFFNFGIKFKSEPGIFILPIIVFSISIILNRVYLLICAKIWPHDSKANIIAFAAGTANTGYFGLPVAFMLFDSRTVAIYVFLKLGMIFYDYTLGAFTIARGKHSRMESLKKVVKMPILYAFFLGALLSYFDITMPANFEVIFNYFAGAYAILGMLIIGLAISHIKGFHFDYRFIGIFLSSRFLAAPAIIILLMYLDTNFFMLFDRSIHLALLLTSIVPPAVNTVVFASIHHAHPEDAATAVVAGTILSIAYLPLMISILF